MKQINFKAIIIILLFLWSVILFFPGSYSVDSWTMYFQMISGKYTDWYSPVLVFTWKVLYASTGRFFTIYIVQMLLYWLFIYLLLVKVNKNNIAFWLGICVSIFLLFIPQYVMKDTHTCIAWGLASVLMITNRNNKPKILFTICTLFLLIYGLFIRVNAIFALFPLLYIWLETNFYQKDKVSKKLAVTTVIFITGIISNYFINYSLLHAQKKYPQYKLKLLDVAGISKLSGEDYIPACISTYRDFNKQKLYSNYTPASMDDIYWSPDGNKPMFPRPTEQLNNCLDSSWKQAILHHPFVYLQNRGQGFLYYLRLKKRFTSDQYWNTAIWISPHNPLHMDSKSTPFKTWVIAFYAIFNPTPVFDPWLWLVINTIFFILFARRFYNNKRIHFYKTQAFIQLSAIIYLLSQFFVYQHDRDFRYTYWNVFVFLIGIISIFYQPETGNIDIQRKSQKASGFM
jgi:hypothetical protein